MASWNEKLIKAVNEGNLTDLKLSIENGAELEYREQGFTPLLIAVRKGYLEIVQYLITAGCVREARTKDGYTPLLNAAYYGHLETVQFLVSVGCEREARTKDDFTPLLIAAGLGHLEIIKYLITVGCDREARTKKKATPLLFAAFKGHLGIIIYLVKIGCDLEARDKLGQNALHVAAQFGHLQVIKWLIEVGGINPSLMTYQGKTPYQLAATTDGQDSSEKRREKNEIMDFLKTAMSTKKQKVSSKIPQQKGLLQVSTENLLYDVFLI